MLFLSVLCLCLCALTLRTQGRGGGTDCVCRDAWLNRKGERASGRVLCRKHVSVWSAEVLWMTHLRWLSLYLSSFFFAPPTYPSCVPTNKVSLCLSYLLTSFNKRWCVWWKCVSGVDWNDSCGGGLSSALLFVALTGLKGTLAQKDRVHITRRVE